MPLNTTDESIGDEQALRRLERFGGVKLRNELTTLFLQEAPVRIAAARVALVEGNVEKVRAVAHMLKSSAGQMGALRMQQLCEQIEGPDMSAHGSRFVSDLGDELVRYIAWLDSVTQSQTQP